MLAKKHKLSRTHDIAGIFSRGRFLHGRYMTVHYRNSDRPSPLFAIAISTKVVKKAVIRNRLRRQIFEIIRLNLDLTKDKNYDIVFVARKNIAETSRKELKEDVLRLLAKIPENRNRPSLIV